MKTIKTVIIEDEKPSARKLQKLLSDFPNLEVVAVLESVEESVTYLSNNPNPDLVFSDIVLGDGLSFDIFEKIPLDCFLIFTTAYDDYMLKAFKLNSIDYLLKPISKEDLEIAIEKFMKFNSISTPFPALDFRELIKTEKPKLKRIVAKIGLHLKIISIDQVCCFYSENKIVYAQTTERIFPTDFSLDELENTLDDRFFFRTNRQIIVNLNYIINIVTSPFYKITLAKQPDIEISVSRERVKEFKEWLNG
jgi:DNA-binding LytR/AlgR family response regulator